MTEFVNTSGETGILDKLSDSSGLTIDVIKFLISQLLGVVFGTFLRVFLPAHKVGTTVRHLFCSFIGLGLTFFCFESASIHVILLPTICYVISNSFPQTLAHKLIMVIALLHLAYVHLMRQIYDYGSYVLDITGPMMVITQKVTSLAFSVSDGLAANPQKLTAEQRHFAVKKKPSFLEYFGYMFFFPALMTGPNIFFKLYINFIEENSATFPPLNQMKFVESGKTLKENDSMDGIYRLPTPLWAVAKKLFASIAYAILLLQLQPSFPVGIITEPAFMQSTSLWKLFLYITAATTITRLKYYHAWSIADAVCTSSGLGFGGFTEDGKAKWQGIPNTDCLGFEGAKALHECTSSWNKSTLMWLRHTVNSRVTNYKVILTYMVSAIWHGFYPGYYITFMTGALFTSAGRHIRTLIRPKFQGTKTMAFCYDVITFTVTKLILGYMAFPFILLDFWTSFTVYKEMYFCFHILALLVIYVLPVLVHPPLKTNQGQNGHLVSQKATKSASNTSSENGRTKSD